MTTTGLVGPRETAVVEIFMNRSGPQSPTATLSVEGSSPTAGLADHVWWLAERIGFPTGKYYKDTTLLSRV